MCQDLGDKTPAAAEQQWFLTSLRCACFWAKKPQAQGEDFWVHSSRGLANLGQEWPERAGHGLTSYFCFDLVRADGKVFYTLLALDLQRVFLCFLWKAAGQMSWQMLELFVLGI